MRIAISAGHNPDGKIACGVVSHLKESTENRYLVKQIIKRNQKKEKIEEIVDCTVNDASSQKDHLTRCAKEHNANMADINIQIHFNAHNGVARGSEILVKQLPNKNDKLCHVAHNILLELSKLGFFYRGVKKESNLYMLNHVDNMMIVEVCFADNENDAHLYNSDKKDVVKAIYKGIWKGLKNAK